MGEHIYRLSLAELTTIRVTCKSCAVTFEMSVKHAGRITANCPHCQAALADVRTAAFQELQRSLQQLADLPGAVVEFPIKVADAQA